KRCAWRRGTCAPDGCRGSPQAAWSVRRVLLAPARLLLYALELLDKQRRLEFGDAQVGAVADVTETRTGRAAAVVMKTLAGLIQIGVVGQDGASFARIQVFRSLEAEAAKRAQRADLAIAPFGQMRLASVLEHRQFTLAAD